MRICWESDPHPQTWSVNHCTYDLPWKELKLGFMGRYRTWFDKVKWNQPLLHLQAGLGTFQKKYFYYFYLLVLQDLKWKSVSTQLPQNTINDELGKLVHHKQDMRKPSKLKLSLMRLGCVSHSMPMPFSTPNQAQEPTKAMFCQRQMSRKQPICQSRVCLLGESPHS